MPQHYGNPGHKASKGKGRFKGGRKGASHLKRNVGGRRK